MPPAAKPWLCACGCGKFIKDRRTQTRHLQGEGPAVARVQQVLRETDDFIISPSPSPSASTSALPPPSASPSRSPSPLRAPSSPPLPSRLPSHPLGGPSRVSPPSNFIRPEHNNPTAPPSTTVRPSPDADMHMAMGDEDTDTDADADFIPDFLSSSNRVGQLDAEPDVFARPSDSSSDSDSELSEEDEDHRTEWDMERRWEEAFLEENGMPGEGLDPEVAIRAAFEAEVAEMRRAGCLQDDEMDDIAAFNFKVDTCMTAAAMTKLPRAFKQLRNLSSLFRIQGRIARLSGITPVYYDCCEESCCAYTGPYAELTTCPFCDKPRYGKDGKPKKRFCYLPITSRLCQPFASAEKASDLDYRAEHKPSSTTITDVFDGTHYKDLCSTHVTVDGKTLPHRHFSDDRDIALGLSVDGVCPFKHRKQTCWPIILLNYNLPPDVRFHLRNVICVGVIPGPKQTKDIDSFLYPLVEELQKFAHGVGAFDVREQEMFLLHAYLLFAFGDMPAMAKLMKMKGHNGICPCRMCTITGVRIPNSRNPVHYVPLHRPSGSLSPTDLPLRTHRQFMANALEVVNATTNARSETLAKRYGIKGIPLLAALSSIKFPTSFPYDFMHLIWENVIKTLVALWTTDYKGTSTDADEPHRLSKSVWEAIGKATAESGSTIPSAFGRRVPDIAESKSEFTAEAWSIWTLFLAPVLLRRRFKQEKFYTHFMALVRLINICLQFEIRKGDITTLREGFAAWVLEYERLYYQYDLQRVSTCTLNIHALLHIPDMIEASGPVWCYWAYVMERYCNFLMQAIKSRRFPFANIDKRVRDLAQLTQIKVMYNLDKELDLSTRKTVEDVGIRFSKYPLHVALISRRLQITPNIHKAIATHLSIKFSIHINVASTLFISHLEAYGKVQRLEGGDMMHASEIVPLKPYSRDMSWVKYSQLVDIYWRFKNIAPVFVQQDFFGQIMYFLRVKIKQNPAISKLNRGANLLIAIIRPCNITRVDNFGLRYYNNSGPIHAVDITWIEGLVGRVWDRKQWAIIEREGIFRRIRIADDEEQEREAEVALTG